MPSRLSKVSKVLKRKTSRAVSNVTHFVKKLGECPGPIAADLVLPSREFTQWWDTTCDWSWDEIGLISSLGSNDTERATRLNACLTRGVSVVHTLLDFVRVLGYKDNWSESELAKFVLYYAGLDLRGDLVANLKYHTLYLANIARSVDPPVRNSNIRSVNGWLLDYKFLRYLKRYSRRHDWAGETLLLGLKRGFPTMDLASVNKELDGLELDLSRTPEHLSDSIIHEIQRTAEQLFLESDTKGTRWPPAPREHYQFSAKAGFEKEAGCKIGGIRGVVWRWAKAHDYCSTEQTLSTMKWGPHCGLVVEYKSMLELSYRNLWEELFQKWLAEYQVEGRRRTKCRVAVIFEPLKVRPITAGEAHRYALGKPMQNALWKSLQKFDCFQLTASKVTAAAVTRQMSVLLPHERARETVEGLPIRASIQEDWFQSGDFKAATNNLNARATQIVVDTVFRGNSAQRALAEDLVGEHEVSYRPMGERTQLHGANAVRTFVQRQGQLMGSMISFPILCAVNAAIIRHAYHLWYDELYPGLLKRRLGFNELPLLINGDDILFRGDLRLMEIWNRECLKVGFIESVGKSYKSKNWVQINSRTFDMDLRSVPGMAVATRQRAFLNFGTIEGYEKGVTPQDEPDLEQISLRLGSFWQEFDHLPWGGVRKRAQELALERLTDRYAHAYRDGFIPFIPSFTNPSWAGGFGLFSAPLEVDKANEALSYKYCKPTVSNFLAGEVEGFWDRCHWKPLDQAGLEAWHEQALLERYRD